MSEYPHTNTTKIYYNGSSKVIRRLCEIVNSLARLGTSHETAFFGDLGQEAYEHSQIIGNPHGTTPADLGIDNRQIAILMNTIDFVNLWVCREDNYEFIDHDGTNLVLVSDCDLLKFH